MRRIPIIFGADPSELDLFNARKNWSNVSFREFRSFLSFFNIILYYREYYYGTTMYDTSMILKWDCNSFYLAPNLTLIPQILR